MRKEQSTTTMQMAFQRSGFKIRAPRRKSWPRASGFKRIDVVTGEVVQVPEDFIEVVGRYRGGIDLESRELDLDSETKMWDACKEETTRG